MFTGAPNNFRMVFRKGLVGKKEKEREKKKPGKEYL